MSQFTKYLRTIDNLIMVRDEDRQPYTEMFDSVRTELVRQMRNVSRVFSRIFSDIILFGSYPNNVRLNTPKEFDVMLVLNVTFDYELTLDVNRPGFLHIEMTDDDDTRGIDREVYKVFKKLCDWRTGKLCRGRLQWWIHDIIQEAIGRMHSWRYEIFYSKRAVAHNIYVKEKYEPFRQFGIDFVPAIFYGGCDFMHVRRYFPFEDEFFENFLAIPKKGGKFPKKSQRFSFMIVNPVAERELLWDKQNLKVAYRLIKSLRDQYNLDRLKSAFITCTFLWEAKRRKPTFWEGRVGEIFLYMLNKLWSYFHARYLPYFWVRDMNMLDILKDEEITEMEKKLSFALRSLRTLKETKSNRQLSFNEVAAHFDIPEYSDDDDSDDYDDDDDDDEEDDDDDSDDYYDDDDGSD